MQKSTRHCLLPGLVLTAALLVSPGHAQTAHSGSAAGDAESPSAAAESITNVEEPQYSRTPSPAPAPGPLDLSTLAILALGVAGLFWVRRHVAEL